MKERIGCIMLTNTTNLEKYGVTQRAIHTLLWSEPETEFIIIPVESNKEAFNQGFIYDMNNPNIDTITPKESFGYNKFLNIGLNMLKVYEPKLPEWTIIANNDIIFTQKWLSKMLNWQKNNPDVLSLSPWEPNWHMKRGLDPFHGPYIGYRTSFEITGWCLVINREVIQKCNLFDPQFEFWYQDNDYALTLEQAKIKHALIPQSRVYHMVSATHDTIDKTKFHKMTDGQLEVLKRKWPNLT
jgi:GT2 family glycosyltransferase